MIQLQHLELRRGIKILFQDANITIAPGSKVGIIGSNGSGKSSLFALLRGELHADAGDVQLPAQWVIAHVAQETPALDIPALDYVLDGDKELRELQTRLQQAETENDGNAIGHIHDELNRIDAWSAEARAGKLLIGLGFATEALRRPVASFSGGWRMRLNLAQALMCRSDLLLLDEPTNHLDLETVLWLEDWLHSYSGTLLLISHDRDFLDTICSDIVEIANQRVTPYSGNYSAFERARAERLAFEQAAFQKQQRQIAHMQSYIDRFKAKATKARQAQSRIKALERLERIAPAHVDTPFDFHFATPDSLPNPLLRLENTDAGYGEKKILHNLELSIESGARIGLLGVNGAGKSTLVKLMCGEIPPLSGELHGAQNLNIGYFAQHQLDTLRTDENPLWHMRHIAPQEREQTLRSFLGGFNFHGDDALSPVGPMSGGEKARLALALIVWRKPNLLLLDEPTNHLDLEMRHALTLALQDFDGALVVVSHDRALLEATTDRFWLVADGQVKPFDGDLEDYRQWRLSQLNEAPRDTSTSNGNDRKQQKREQAEQRQQRAAQRKPLQTRLHQLEKQLETLNAEKTELEVFLADERSYQPDMRHKLADASRRQGELTAQLNEVEEDWLNIQEALDALQQENP